MGFEKELPILPRLEAFGGAEYDTREGWEGEAGLRYSLGRSVSLAGAWHADYGWGAGLALRF